MIRRLAPAYFAGALAALASAAAVWVAARAGLLATAGVSIAPRLDWTGLAPQLLAGSLWGLGYPLARWWGMAPVRAGLLVGLAPALAQLFVVLPGAGRGMLGVELGPLTPVVVLAQYALWGWVLAVVARRIEGG